MSEVTNPSTKLAKVKQKPASHAFRVSTDDVRLAFRDRRTAELEPRLARRRAIAGLLSPEAPFVLHRDEGFVIVPPGAFDFSSVVSAARGVVARADLAEKKAKANKAFMVKLADREELSRDSPFLQLGLRRDLVAIAAQYLGLVPILEYANVFYSSHAGDDLAKSQLYHCDSDEAEQVKLFVLCEDVTPEHGPLTFISAADSQRVRDRVGYRYNTRLTDDDVRAALDGDVSEVPLLGHAGMAGLVDTSRCFHYGSRFSDTSARRVVVMLQYVTPLAFLYADDHRASARFRHLATPEDDEFTTLVLGSQ